MINKITTSTSSRKVIEKDETMSGAGANWKCYLMKVPFLYFPSLSNEASFAESHHCSNKSSGKNGI